MPGISTVPEKQKGMWETILSQANFKVQANQAVKLNVVIVYHQELERSFGRVYERLRDLVNKFNSYYQLGAKPFATVRAGDMDRHWGSVEKFFGGTKIPANIFVVDFFEAPLKIGLRPSVLRGEADAEQTRISFAVRGLQHLRPQQGRR